jgi:hypothetical protein
VQAVTAGMPPHCRWAGRRQGRRSIPGGRRRQKHRVCQHHAAPGAVVQWPKGELLGKACDCCLSCTCFLHLHQDKQG